MYPGVGGKEGGDREQQRNSEERSAEESENRTEKAVEEAKTDGMGGATKDFGEQIGSDHGVVAKEEERPKPIQEQERDHMESPQNGNH